LKSRQRETLTMPTLLEVETELASKIQVRARERGVSVDVYLRELIDLKGAELARGNERGSRDRVRLLREWTSSHSVNAPLLSEDSISHECIYGERG
jgi:hypothetical protein